jgi:hypothetical protein
MELEALRPGARAIRLARDACLDRVGEIQKKDMASREQERLFLLCEFELEPTPERAQEIRLRLGDLSIDCDRLEREAARLMRFYHERLDAADHAFTVGW